MSVRLPLGLGAVFAIAIVALPTGVPALAQDEATTPVSFTAAQVTRGKSAYTKSCADCHGAGLDGQCRACAHDIPP